MLGCRSSAHEPGQRPVRHCRRRSAGGLGLVDTDLRFVRVNDALAAINGRPVEEHVGRRIDEVLPELADALVPVYQHVLETGEPILEREIVRETASSHVRHVLASWFPVHVEDGSWASGPS